MKFWQFHPNIQIRFGLLFINTVAQMTIMPFIIIYFSDRIGPIVTGLMFLGVMAATVAGNFAGGYISDKVGRKKLMLAAEFLIMLGYFGAALANSPWADLTYVTFVLFLLINFSGGAATPVNEAMIIDVSSVKDRKAIYTFSYWLSNLAVAIGSMIGALLFQSHHFILFLIVGGTSMIAFFTTLFFIQESHTPVKAAPTAVPVSAVSGFLKGYGEVLKNKVFIAFAAGSFFIAAVEEQLTNYIGIRLDGAMPEAHKLVPFLSVKLDGVGLLGFLKTENTILVVSLTIVVGLLLKFMRDRSALLTGLLLYFAGYTIISFSSSPLILILAMFFATLGEMLHIPVKQTMLAGLVPDNARSTFMAFYTFVMVLGASTAGIFVIISAWLPTSAMAVIFGLMGASCMTIFGVLSGKSSHNQEEIQEAK